MIQSSLTHPVYAGLSSPKAKAKPFISQGFYQGLMYGWQPYSHAYLRFTIPGTRLDWVFHSTGIGSHFVSFKRFCVDRERFEEYEIGVPDARFWEFAEKCGDLATTKYPTGEIVGIAFARIVKLILRIEMRKNWWGMGEREQFCSETAQRLVAFLVPQFEWTKSSDLVSPFDFREGMLLMERHGLATLAYSREKDFRPHMAPRSLGGTRFDAIRPPEKRASRIVTAGTEVAA